MANLLENYAPLLARHDATAVSARPPVSPAGEHLDFARVFAHSYPPFVLALISCDVCVQPPPLAYLLTWPPVTGLLLPPPLLAAGGSIFLIHKKKCRSFRKDGHTWVKNPDGKTTRERHVKLKGRPVLVAWQPCAFLLALGVILDPATCALAHVPAAPHSAYCSRSARTAGLRQLSVFFCALQLMERRRSTCTTPSRMPMR